MAGTTDTVPAMLTPGEFVIKQESAAMLGEAFLKQLNAFSDNAAHGNIDALIGQAQLANMKPMYGGGNVVPGYENGGDVLGEKELGLVAKLLSKLSGAGRRQSAYDEMVPSSDNVDMPLKLTNYRMPFEDELSGSGESGEPKMSKAQIASYFKGKEMEELMRKIAYADVDMRAYPEYLSSDFLRADTRGRPEVQDEEGYGWNPFQDVNIPQQGFENGGGVGEAGRQYPPGTLMSPFMGDKALIPEAWMQPATESMPSPEEVAEFDRMIKTLQAQELMRKMKEMQEAGMFNEAEEIKFEENIKFDEKSILPPPRVKKDFKNNLYEGFFLPKL